MAVADPALDDEALCEPRERASAILAIIAAFLLALCVVLAAVFATGGGGLGGGGAGGNVAGSGIGQGTGSGIGAGNGTGSGIEGDGPGAETHLAKDCGLHGVLTSGSVRRLLVLTRRWAICVANSPLYLFLGGFGRFRIKV
mgnify:CR=1 FL=1